MKRIKWLTATAMAGMLTLSAPPIFADEPQVPIAEEEVRDQVIQEEASDQAAQEETQTTTEHHEYYEPYEPYETEDAQNEKTIPPFLSFTGKVIEIIPVVGNTGRPIEHQYFVKLQSEEYGTAILRTDHNTFFIGEAIGEGDTITGWYSSDTPWVLVYPPQHLARVLINGHKENFKLSHFHLDPDRGMLVSEDNQLVLNFTDVTPLITQDGEKFQVPRGSALLNELDGRLLIVTYSTTDRMLPAGTMISDPDLAITVLRNETDEPQAAQSNPKQYPNDGISVNGDRLDVAWKQIEEAYYVPFRAVVDALGHGETIIWDSLNQTISVSNGATKIHFPISSSAFIVGQEVKSLQSKVVLDGGTTYVPWQFFRDVFGVSAWFSEGQVFISSQYEIEQ
ncbi:MAG: copper amine oxidase N-terminal domain-containing protein [Defluviitaleaceae bacterium]|nr:copper amine oxidase N-terminal domain-containing protein [Defluviitaleaceae bacterium]